MHSIYIQVNISRLGKTKQKQLTVGAPLCRPHMSAILDTNDPPFKFAQFSQLRLTQEHVYTHHFTLVSYFVI